MVAPTFANINPAKEYEGTLYTAPGGTPLTATEADLFAGPDSGPIAVPFFQAMFATVLFAATGPIRADTAYVVLQTDCNDGNWIDVAWCVWNGTAGTALFCLTAGAFTCNGFQQNRPAGQAPSGNGSNQVPLGGRIRFVGAATIGGQSSSSSSSGAPGPQVTATIRYKNLGLR